MKAERTKLSDWLLFHRIKFPLGLKEFQYLQLQPLHLLPKPTCHVHLPFNWRWRGLPGDNFHPGNRYQEFGLATALRSSIQSVQPSIPIMMPNLSIRAATRCVYALRQDLVTATSTGHQQRRPHSFIKCAKITNQC